MDHSIPVRSLKQEAAFYNDAQQTYDGLEDFKRRVMRQNQEFNTLLQYYQQNEGRIDFSSVMDGNGGLRPHRPNLGTDHQSWFYLDERGNKVWVQNMMLDTSDVKSGAFASNQHADGRVIVVKVPTHKKNYCLQPDYKKKCMEYDSYRRVQNLQNPPVRPSSAFGGGGARPESSRRAASAGKYPMVSPFANPQNTASPWVPGGGASSGYCEQQQGVGGQPTTADRYVASQQALAQQVRAQQQHQYYHSARLGHFPNSNSVGGMMGAMPLTTHGGQYVYRPPTSVEEADARLEELRREEAWLMQQAQL